MSNVSIYECVVQVGAVVHSSLQLYDLVMKLKLSATEISEGSASFSQSFPSRLKTSLELLEKVRITIFVL